MRERGFYWAEFRKEILVAEWDGSAWGIPNCDEPIGDDEIATLSDRLEPPVK